LTDLILLYLNFLELILKLLEDGFLTTTLEGGEGSALRPIGRLTKTLKHAMNKNQRLYLSTWPYALAIRT